MAMEAPALMASLYVGDLHPEVMENDLVDMFGRVGPLISVRVCRDKFSRKSLCYGYVNFWFRCHASTALKYLNHARLKGKTMRIMWYDRNPVTRKSTIGNLFMKNLDPSITSAHLEKIFSKYGTILSCKVAEEDGESKGFGFVQFDSEDSAVAALNALHDTELEGKNLYVSKFLRQTERKDTECCFKNLYVNNLDDGITEDILKDKFSEHGKVSRVVIIKDEAGKPRGYGFVNFESHEGAKQAKENLNGELLGSKNLFVAWAQRKTEMKQRFGQVCGFKSRHSQGSNLYVKNLNPSVDDIKLKELFNHYGNLISAKVIRNEGGASKNFGFVHFVCPDEANRALNSLSGTDFEGNTLHVALARRQEQRTSRLHKPCMNFPSEPQYIPDCGTLDCSFPYFSPPMQAVQLNQWDPNFYRNLAGPFSSCNPFQGQRFPGIFNTPPMPVAALKECRQYNLLELRNKPSSQSQNKNSGNVNKYQKGHGAVQGSLIVSSSDLCKSGLGFLSHPHVQNLQPGLATSGNGMQLEMTQYAFAGYCARPDR